MGLRVCLVTPFAWSRPHDVNEHVDGLARELRALGHEVTVLAPSTRASDLVAGRRALLDGVGAEAPLVGADQKGVAGFARGSAKTGLSGATRRRSTPRSEIGRAHV